MRCWDRCATDEYDSVIRRLEGVENKNLDQDRAISALAKLGDVKTIEGLSESPTQSEINDGWMVEVGKPPETGDLVLDVGNSKVWVYVNDTWVVYGDSLSTLLDTTIPALQDGVNNSVKKTGDIMTGNLYGPYASFSEIFASGGFMRVAPSEPNDTYTEIQSVSSSPTNSRMNIISRRGGPTRVTIFSAISNGDDSYTTTSMRATPTASDVVNYSRLLDAYDELVVFVDEQDSLKADKTEVDDGLALKLDKTGGTLSGRLYANGGLSIELDAQRGLDVKRTDVSYNGPWARYRLDRVFDKDDKQVGELAVTCINDDPTYGVVTGSFLTAINYKSDNTPVRSTLAVRAQSTGDCFVEAPMRTTPGASDVVNKTYLDARLNAITNAMAKAGMTLSVEEPTVEEMQMAMQGVEDA